MRIFLSPHNDDEALFGSIIIQRLKPLLLVIVTDSFIQGDRGDPITWQERRLESSEAARIMGVPICFLGIRDSELCPRNLRDALSIFDQDAQVIAPAIQGGNAHHDCVGQAAQNYFPCVWQYSTYAKGEHSTPIAGSSFHATEEEAALKERVLNCYPSQILLKSTRPHFDAVRGPANLLGWPREYLFLLERTENQC